MLTYLNLLKSRERIYFFLIIITVVLTALLETIGIGLIIPIINIYLNPEFLNEFYFINYIKKFLDFNKFEFLFLIFILVFFSIKTFLLILFKWFETKFSAYITTRLSSDLFKYYVNQDYEFFLLNNSSLLIRNTIQEVKIFVGNVIGSIIIIFSEFLLFSFLIILAFLYEPKITIYIVFVFCLFLIVYYLFVKKIISKWGEIRQIHDGLRIKTLQESFGGNKDIKILKAEKRFSKSFDKDTYLTNQMLMRIKFTNLIPKIIIEYLAIIFVISFLFLSINNNSVENTISSISIFAIIGIKLMPSLNKILSSLQTYRFGKIAFEKLKNLNFEKVNNHKKTSINASIENLIKIEFLDVSYSYPSTNINKIFALKKLSFNISSGDFVSIEGMSGSGKSTLVDLMTGILKPISGKILINEKYTLNQIGNLNYLLGYCPQKVFLIDDSIKSNIAFGIKEKNVDVNKILNLLDIVCLNDMISNFPNGLNTFVGEKGVKISGGQLQRIGIARSLYNNPKLLILDEATNSIDINLEQEILTKIRKKFPKLIIIFISHGSKLKFNFSKIINLNKLKH